VTAVDADPENGHARLDIDAGVLTSKIWVISHLTRADLAIYRERAGEHRKHVSLILTDSGRYSTSHGLETARP